MRWTGKGGEGKPDCIPARLRALWAPAPYPTLMEESKQPREDKSASYTLSITLLLMAVLVIAAWVLKRNAAGHNKPAAGNDPAGPAAGATRPPGHATGAPSIPLDTEGQPLSEYQVITDTRLVDDAAADGDTFRVNTPQGSHLFRLYWVQTVQMNGGSPESIREATDHFGLKTEEHLRSLAVEASDFTQSLLRNVQFRIVTRWEKDPAEGAYLCFAYAVDHALPPPGLQNLALLLVQNGLAVIKPCNRPLPEPETSAGDFQNQLSEAEAEAKRTLSGGWASRGG